MLILLFSCTAPPKSSSNLNISFIKDPTTLDPRKAADLSSTSCAFLLYEGLFRSGKNGQIENAICDHFSVSKDGKNYRFFLKKTKWSDGSALIAKDFEHSFKSQLDPNFGSPYSYLFDCIKNAKACKSGFIGLENVGIRAIDDYTLEIQLEYPKSDFIDLLAFSPFFPFKQDHLSAVFNGPYYLQKRSLRKEWKLKKNPFFHDAALIHFSTLTIKIIESENSGIQMFEEGKLDIMGGPLSPLPIDYTFKHKAPIFQPMAGSTLCVFNTKSSIFSNLNMRKAFAFAINSNAIIKGQSYTKTTPTGFLPKTLLSSSELINTSKNKLSALEYLNAGLNELKIKKEDLNQLTYYFGSKPEHTKTAQILKELWKETLGVEINLQKIEHKTLSEKIAHKEFDFAQLIWLAPYSSPNALLDRFNDPLCAKNFSSFSSNGLKNLINDLDVLTHHREESLLKIQQIFSEQIPFIPLYDWQYPYLHSPKIKNLVFTKVGTLNFTYLENSNQTCD